MVGVNGNVGDNYIKRIKTIITMMAPAMMMSDDNEVFVIAIDVMI